MAGNPQQVADDTTKIIKAWQTLASSASFGGMTLDEFKAKTKPSFDAREGIEELDDQMTAALNTRDDADVETQNATTLVVNGVKGDPNFGEDCNLYEAMGYVRKSERKTGLSRTKPTPPPAK